MNEPSLKSNNGLVTLSREQITEITKKAARIGYGIGLKTSVEMIRQSETLVPGANLEEIAQAIESIIPETHE
jgi:hypothetical protein